MKLAFKASKFLRFTIYLFGGHVFELLTYPGSEIVLRAMGRAINKTVTFVELIKRSIVGLHQITSIGSTDITDTWEPLENVFQSAIPDEDGSAKEKDETWPFHNIFEQLILDMFDLGKLLPNSCTASYLLSCILLMTKGPSPFFVDIVRELLRIKVL
nr:ribonuclease P protein subunit p25-like protein [Tanacetum cinerariifolium]